MHVYTVHFQCKWYRLDCKKCLMCLSEDESIHCHCGTYAQRHGQYSRSPRRDNTEY